jgi:hypothetical protein
VHQPFRMDPAQRVLADVERSTIPAHAIKPGTAFARRSAMTASPGSVLDRRRPG